MGSDSLMKLHTWKKWQMLVRETNIAVAMRQGDSLHQTPRELHAWLGKSFRTAASASCPPRCIMCRQRKSAATLPAKAFQTASRLPPHATSANTVCMKNKVKSVRNGYNAV